ncbi:glycoside hydrolase family 25 protein [Corynebacterium glaucum]|uniref:glycoside hydrolase family 25 protein n=1 Tax=Corynebacterium glaucum TaxID=187491 RepID=UPI002659F5A5|nr:glycoside hydrolase family 25 protein [Corynebacterium glaucum]
MRLGVDVSEHQPSFDFTGFDFAILRTTDGTYQDRAFTEHLARARSAGITDISTYHYLRAPSEGTTITEQVEAALSAVGELRLPVWLDVESPQGLSLIDVSSAHSLFTQRGFEVAGIYTTANYWRRHMRIADVRQFGALWLADWRDNPRVDAPDAVSEGLADPASWPRPFGFPEPAIWQFTSRGRVSSTDGPIDVDLNLAR